MAIRNLRIAELSIIRRGVDGKAVTRCVRRSAAYGQVKNAAPDNCGVFAVIFDTGKCGSVGAVATIM
jgi:hypothetical protein